MESRKLGRVLGIGVRVASNILRERAGSPPALYENTEQARATAQKAARVSANKTRNLGHGARRFGQAVWGPITHASGVLWLEVTGLFFALFALFFAQNLYRVHAAWKQGADHPRFLVYCVLTIIFAWFSSSSFLRARRKSKRSHS